MIDVKKLQTLDGMLDYPDPNDASKGTTEQQFQEYLKNHYAVMYSIVAMSLWQPGTNYIVGQVVLSPNMPANTIARVTAAGSSGDAEPVWGNVGSTISDGTVTYIMLPRTIDFASQAEVTAGKVDNKIVTPAMLGQTIQVDLASTKRVNINEAGKSVTPGVTGILPVAHGGTGLDHLPYTPNEHGSAWDGTHFPAIGFDGVAEVGRYLDFHEKSADPSDYSLRLESSGGNLLVNGTDIMNYIRDVKSQAGVVAGDVSNANAWWVKLSGAVPLIIQGGKSAMTNRYETIKFPISFTTIFSIIGQALTSDVLAGSESNFGIKTDFTTTQFTTSMYDNGNYYAGFHWIAIGI